uniref:Uncharacterized protein n=1 Tax=Chloropicon primus TaxID=1764295 RepID=A0A7S2WZH5_9CHLO
MAAGEGGQPPGGEGEGQGKRTWSFSFKRAVNVAKGLNPIQTKRVSQIKDVAFEKVEGTKKYIQDMDISGEVRTRLYREYNERLRSIEPDLRNMGRAMGNQMLVSEGGRVCVCVCVFSERQTQESLLLASCLLACARVC